MGLFQPQPARTGSQALDTVINLIQNALARAVDTLEVAVRSVTEPAVAKVDANHVMTGELVINYVGTGGHTIVLPPASSIPGLRSLPRFILNNGTGVATVLASGSDRVGGAVSTTVPIGALAVLVGDGASLWQVLGAAFRAASLVLTSNLNVGGAATVTGRLTANGDQLRVGVSTLLVLAGAVSGPYLGAQIVGDLRAIQFGTVSAVVVGSPTLGGGLQIGSAPATDKLAFLGATPRAQFAAITSPTGGATVDTEARAAIDSIRDCLGKTNGFGLTAT